MLRPADPAIVPPGSVRTVPKIAGKVLYVLLGTVVGWVLAVKSLNLSPVNFNEFQNLFHLLRRNSG